MRVLEKYNCKNILHIGGHWGEEADEYIALGADFTFVEPVKEFAEVIRSKGYKCLEMAIGTRTGDFYVDRGLSSFLKTNYERTPVRTEQVTAVPLSEIEAGFDTLIIDTEGTDFEVLQSGTLQYAKTIVVELRKEALFIGETTQEWVEEYLLTKGFKKVEEHVLFDDPNAFDVYFVKQ
jgi:hypothetical protein